MKHVERANRERMAALPFRIDLRPEGGHKPGRRVILVHGTPTLNTLYWHADRSDAFCLKMARAAGAVAGDVIAFGHTHVPWFREVEGVHFLNAGSVGRPRDGDWRACYVALDVSKEKPTATFHRIEYDLEAAMKGIRKSSLPDAFADHLAAGRKLPATSQDASSGPADASPEPPHASSQRGNGGAS